MPSSSIYDVLYQSHASAHDRNAPQFDWLFRRDLTGVRTALDLGWAAAWGTSYAPCARARVQAVGVDYSASCATASGPATPTSSAPT